ncbi:IS3 family transposase [Candidatus Erwinia dacicola]|uniref:HTH-like domain protein n=1 Tax=Candidatus Erwinia dacicola TaxID=252393 RepID=A0A328TTF0_9GAMM|nr:IS3 family transposase [Candidatus Erwinia dacicola]RAP72095.1 HTH-like domain protein [Candidatus Erwinia dacicola]
MSRAQLSVAARRQPDWQDGRKERLSDDREILMRIQRIIAGVPTYGYRRVWALLRRESESEGLTSANARKVYRI